MEQLASDVLDACRAKGWTLATAESCTGGMVVAALTQISGSSDVVDRGYVTYSNAAKMQMINVKGNTLGEYGAVSEPVAKEMADGALEASHTDISVSITGIAGPGPSEHKPEGRVCFGLAVKGQKTQTQTVEFGPLGRENVRLESAQFALNLILNAAK
ncbi:CinA family protein [Amylibacter sp. SFDW26]|uniref:CinA family protein n=1 Tax=Amylibacter sp. SFDW26 TaxID=2652722 RepID=UPI001261D727|nr:CinA family protein [Amylibacter sp. SFDW26]KAB7615742.1 CinA family protein [Amylibacter sp. SFDW26]